KDHKKACPGASFYQGDGTTLLAGDIGGTKTALAVYSTEAGPRAPLAQAQYPSADFGGIEEMSQRFLQSNGLQAETACFAIAGPVLNGKAKLTNLPWTADSAK